MVEKKKKITKEKANFINDTFIKNGFNLIASVLVNYEQIAHKDVFSKDDTLNSPHDIRGIKWRYLKKDVNLIKFFDDQERQKYDVQNDPILLIDWGGEFPHVVAIYDGKSAEVLSDLKRLDLSSIQLLESLIPRFKKQMNNGENLRMQLTADLLNVINSISIAASKESRRLARFLTNDNKAKSLGYQIKYLESSSDSNPFIVSMIEISKDGKVIIKFDQFGIVFASKINRYQNDFSNNPYLYGLIKWIIIRLRSNMREQLSQVQL